MKNYEMLINMLMMQCGLDKAVFEKMNMNYYPTQSQYCKAIIDEIGELNHELKPEWCWWKKNPGIVDDQKVLEELVDIWHFALSFANSAKFTPNPNTLNGKYKPCDVTTFTSFIVAGIFMVDCEGLFRHMHALTVGLGYSMEDVFDAYTKKNAVNHQRAESDY